MARIPGLDVFGPTDRSPNIFHEFFPIPDDIGNMRREEDYCFRISWSLKAPVHFVPFAQGESSSKSHQFRRLTFLAAKCFEGDMGSKKEIAFFVYKQNKNYDEELKNILQEKQILKDLNHENVLKFYEFISGDNLTDVGFVFEPVGGLMSHLILSDEKVLYEPPVIKSIMRNLYTALAYLHQNNIVHRDIQPENIAFSPNGVLKLWNFRHARKIGQKPKKLKVNEFRYQPVDVLMMSENYNKAVDIWAANCIFAQLWMKHSLFPEHGREKVLAAIFKLLGFPSQEIWEEFYSLPGADNVRDFANCCKYNMVDKYFKKYCGRTVPPSAMELIRECFCFNPKYRPSAEQCLIRPYFYEEPEECLLEDMIPIIAQAYISIQLRKIKTDGH